MGTWSYTFLLYELLLHYLSFLDWQAGLFISCRVVISLYGQGSEKVGACIYRLVNDGIGWIGRHLGRQTSFGKGFFGSTMSAGIGGHMEPRGDVQYRVDEGFSIKRAGLVNSAWDDSRRVNAYEYV